MGKRRFDQTQVCFPRKRLSMKTYWVIKQFGNTEGELQESFKRSRLTPLLCDALPDLYLSYLQVENVVRLK